MSDQNTALPVRTEGDLQQKLQSKIVDFTDPTKGQIVDSDGNAHAEMHGNDAAGVDRVIKTNEEGNIALDGDYDASTNTNPSSVGLVAHDRHATPGAAQQNKRITAVQNGTKVLMDMALHDEDGNPYTPSNPLHVAISDSEGVEINDYKQATAVAAGATDNHDYTVTAAKTLKLSKIMASASGKIKVEVQIETAPASGTYASKFVKFNSTAEPNLDFDIKELITVPAGTKVRVIITNREPQAQDVYSTISGHEI